MVKKGWVLFVVLVAAVALAGLSCGKSDQERSSQAPTPPIETARPDNTPPPAGGPGPAGVPGPAPMTGMPKQATGEVVSANPTMKTLVVKSEGGQMTFDVKDSAAGDLAKIKRGDRVTVQYTEDGGKNTAESIKKG